MQFELAFICAIVTQTDYKPSVEDVLRAMNKVTYEDNACTPPSCFEYKGAHAYMPYVDETVCSTYVLSKYGDLYREVVRRRRFAKAAKESSTKRSATTATETSPSTLTSTSATTSTSPCRTTTEDNPHSSVEVEVGHLKKEGSNDLLNDDHFGMNVTPSVGSIALFTVSLVFVCVLALHRTRRPCCMPKRRSDASDEVAGAGGVGEGVNLLAMNVRHGEGGNNDAEAAPGGVEPAANLPGQQPLMPADPLQHVDIPL